MLVSYGCYAPGNAIPLVLFFRWSRNHPTAQGYTTSLHKNDIDIQMPGSTVVLSLIRVPTASQGVFGLRRLVILSEVEGLLTFLGVAKK